MKSIFFLSAIIVSCVHPIQSVMISHATMGKSDKPKQTHQSTVANNAKSVAEGQVLYQAHCQSCHGIGLQGDGPKAEELNLAPSDLSDLHVKYKDFSYLYEQIAIGQEGMPTWQDKLFQDKIWKIAYYIYSKNDFSTDH